LFVKVEMNGSLELLHMKQRQSRELLVVGTFLLAWQAAEEIQRCSWRRVESEIAASWVWDRLFLVRHRKQKSKNNRDFV